MNETMTLKLELAKERGLNEALQEEINYMKDQFLSEIHLLEETIQMQNEVINELRETKKLHLEKSSLLDDSTCETQHEADLTSDVWLDYQERKTQRNREGFKIIMDLASQIDQLKVDLENEIRLVDELKTESKSMSLKLRDSKDYTVRLETRNTDLLEANEQLHIKIGELEEHHKDEIHTLNNRLRAHEMKIKSLTDRLKKIEDCSTFGWFSLLSKYAITA